MHATTASNAAERHEAGLPRDHTNQTRGTAFNVQ